MDMFQVLSTHWSAGSPFASWEAHPTAPLWIQQYVSMPTVYPLYFLMWIGSDASFKSGRSPWIPILIGRLDLGREDVYMHFCKLKKISIILELYAFIWTF